MSDSSTIRGILRGALLACATVLAFGAFAAHAAEGAVGKWDIVVNFQGQEFPSELTISEKADGSLEGVISSMQGEVEVPSITFENGKITFTAVADAQGQEMEFTFEGTVKGDTLTGTFSSDFGEMDAEGTRAGAAPAAGGAEGIVGEWELTSESQMGTFERKLIINSDLSGKYIGDIGEFDVENLKVDGSDVTFEVTIELQGQELLLEFEGTLDGETLKGDFLVQGTPAAQVTAKRIVSAIPEPPAIVGTWDVTSESQMGTFERKMVINPDLSGKYIGDIGEFDIENLKVDGSQVTFEVTIEVQGQELLLEFEGSIDGETLKGDFLVQGTPAAQVTAKKTGGAPGGGAGTMVGTWAIDADSMVGPLDQKMVVASDGSITFESDGVASEVTDLKVDGNRVTFNVTLSGYDLEFEGTLDGSELTGDYLMGGSSVATVTGTRAGSGSSAAPEAPAVSLNISDLKGSWKLQAESAVGPLDQKLVVAADNSVTFDSDDVECEVTNFAVNGNKLTFNVTILGYDLEFEGTVQGPDLSELKGDYLMGGGSVATVTGKKVE